MTTAEACTVIVDLLGQLRDERALTSNLEADVRVYRELVSVLLAELHDWQRDPARQQRRQEQRVRDLRAVLTAAFHSEAA